MVNVVWKLATLVNYTQKYATAITEISLLHILNERNYYTFYIDFETLSNFVGFSKSENIPINAWLNVILKTQNEEKEEKNNVEM